MEFAADAQPNAKFFRDELNKKYDKLKKKVRKIHLHK